MDPTNDGVFNGNLLFSGAMLLFGGYTLRQSNIAGWKSYIVTNSRTTYIYTNDFPASRARLLDIGLFVPLEEVQQNLV